MSAVVIGIGQHAAGDDAIGLVVARALAARGFDARACADASAVLDLAPGLVAAGRRVVIVDAVVDGEPGRVHVLTPEQLASGPQPLSSHGISVADALSLARTLYGALDVVLVGITIAPPSHDHTLSPAVAAAVEPAVALAIELARA